MAPTRSRARFNIERTVEEDLESRSCCVQCMSHPNCRLCGKRGDARSIRVPSSADSGEIKIATRHNPA